MKGNYFESKLNKLYAYDSNAGGQEPNILQQTESLLTKRLSYAGPSDITWTGQTIPIMSEHSAHLAPFPELNHPGDRRISCFIST